MRKVDTESRKRQRQQEIIDAVTANSRAVLLGAFERAKKTHKSLIGIHEVDRDGTHDYRQILIDHGYADWTPIPVNYTATPTGEDDVKDGGGVSFIRREEGGPVRAVMFIRRDMTGEDDSSADAVNLMIFYHELGHVDDFERGSNIVLGRPLDAVECELYAHRYACKHLMKNRQRYLVRLYLSMVLQQHAFSNNEHVQAAARRFLKSGEARNYAEYIRPTYEISPGDPFDPDKLIFDFGAEGR